MELVNNVAQDHLASDILVVLKLAGEATVILAKSHEIMTN